MSDHGFNAAHNRYYREQEEYDVIAQRVEAMPLKDVIDALEVSGITVNEDLRSQLLEIWAYEASENGRDF